MTLNFIPRSADRLCMRERRTRPRNLCSDIVELFWNDRLGWPHRAKAILEDISVTGACVQTETSIPVDTELALRMGELGFPGNVRYCTLIGGSYFVGVEFLAGTQWMADEYKPKHILMWPTPEIERATLEMSESFIGGAAPTRS
jgi:hypothetical protein